MGGAVVRGFLLGIAVLLAGFLADFDLGILITGAVIMVLSGAGCLYLKTQQRR